MMPDTIPPRASGDYVTLAARDGGSFRAYCARPADRSGPGLVILQEIFGVTADLRALSERYAEEGYVVLVPDLFWRIEPGIELGHDERGLQQAFALHRRFDEARAVEDVADTVAALRAMPEQVGGVGCLGFCLGGKLAYLAAARTDVDCAIGYYGLGIENALDEAARIRVPLMLPYRRRRRLLPARSAGGDRRRVPRQRGRRDPRLSRLRARVRLGGAP